MPSTKTVIIASILASSALAAPAPTRSRSVTEEVDAESSISARDVSDSTNELDERFFFLGPLLAQGIRAGVQAGVRAGVRKGAQAGARHGAKHAANHSNNNNNRNHKSGAKHRRDLEDNDLELDVRQQNAPSDLEDRALEEPSPDQAVDLRTVQDEDPFNMYDRDIVDADRELDERFFFLGPLLAQGIRAGVQAGVRAGVRKGAQAGAKHGAKHAANHHNNQNNQNNRGRRRQRDLQDEDDMELYARELMEADGELDERFFFLGPLLAQGIRAGVQAGVRAGVRKGAQAGAKHGAKHAAQQHNNHNNNNRGKRRQRDLDSLEEQFMTRSVAADELEWDVAGRDLQSLEELD